MCVVAHTQSLIRSTLKDDFGIAVQGRSVEQGSVISSRISVKGELAAVHNLLTCPHGLFQKTLIVVLQSQFLMVFAESTFVQADARHGSQRGPTADTGARTKLLLDMIYGILQVVHHRVHYQRTRITRLVHVLIVRTHRLVVPGDIRISHHLVSIKTGTEETGDSDVMLYILRIAFRHITGVLQEIVDGTQLAPVIPPAYIRGGNVSRHHLVDGGTAGIDGIIVRAGIIIARAYISVKTVCISLQVGHRLEEIRLGNFRQRRSLQKIRLTRRQTQAGQTNQYIFLDFHIVFV